jgi:hypothetical protein
VFPCYEIESEFLLAFGSLSLRQAFETRSNFGAGFGSPESAGSSEMAVAPGWARPAGARVIMRDRKDVHHATSASTVCQQAPLSNFDQDQTYGANGCAWMKMARNLCHRPK